MKLRSALLAATVLAAAPIAAKAQAVSGLYIGAGAGANFMQNESITRTSFPFLGTKNSNNISLHLDTGFVGVGSIGYGLGNGLRFELEGSYRQNKFNKSVGATTFNAGGDEMKYGAMFNVLYDIDPAVFGMGRFPVVPYVGVGGGYQWVQERNMRTFGVATGLGASPSNVTTLYRTNDGKGDFAYQAIVGASFPLAAVPGLSLTAEYRFMGLAENRTYNVQYFNGKTETRARRTFDDDYNHSVLLGIRYAFNAAPAPVVVGTAPVAPSDVSRTYLVFFDWDRADLTDRARQIIAQAAQATTRTQVTRIAVNGYTDLSGTARYNQGLSERRARNVAAELMRLGVPRQSITTQGFGETHPLVPTANGVREPQNRRVEIILQ